MVSCLTALCGAQALLDPTTQNKFVEELPIPNVLDTRTGGTYSLPVSQFSQWLGLRNTTSQLPMFTTVWGYNGEYPGPTILAKENVTAQFAFPNELRVGGVPLPHLFPVDTSIHWADPLNQGNLGVAYPGPVPIVTHLHGGHLTPMSDGYPEAWYTPGNGYTGTSFNPVYTYENTQRPATLWYHDHTLGITRLNVNAGLAGAYVITNDQEQALKTSGVLPPSPYDVPLIIQDREFTDQGQLYYPTTASGAPNPTIVPEFFGRFILVNGKIWPKQTVEPRAYRYRVVNGSDSRVYTLDLGGITFFQITTDGGFMRAPIARTSLTLSPGERADIVVDFNGLNGQTIYMSNTARYPFPVGTVPNTNTDGKVICFTVSRPLNTAYPDVRFSEDSRMLAPVRPLGAATNTRKLTLFMGGDTYGRMNAMLGTVAQGGLAWHDPVTENPHLNDTEIWEVYNTYQVAHPIHLHLVEFEIVNRQAFTATRDSTGKLTNIVLTGSPIPPDSSEWGPKDTAIAYGRQVLRIKMKFDKLGQYVWHCHFLAHEDHDMMRPYTVIP